MRLIGALLQPARLLRRALRRASLLLSAVECDLAASRGGYRAHAPPLCLVSHDAYRHGAQLLCLELAQRFARVFGLRLHIVILGPGPLTAKFRRYGRVHELAAQTGSEADALARQLSDAGVKFALCNSVASGLFVKTLSSAGIRCVSLVHELPGIISERGLTTHADTIRRTAAVTVFPTETVRDRFPGGAPANSIVRAQGLAHRHGPPDARRRASARAMLRRRFGISENASLVIAAGYGDMRKGIDLFVAIGARVMSADAGAHFLWAGGVAPEKQAEVSAAVQASGFANRFTFAPFEPDLAPFYAGADVFALTSREDPFPTVLLEAQDAALPVVAFAGAGGFEDLLGEGGGVLAAQGDAEAFAALLLDILRDPVSRQKMATAAAAAMSTGFAMRNYAFGLATLAKAAPPRISVVVPSYDYARYLPARLRSILSQTLPVYEVIVLDDFSSDQSPAIARTSLSGGDLDWRVIEAERKAASVFSQWRRGVAEARGDFVWIAEADDLCHPRFLEAIAAGLADPDVVLSYCQSRQIDGDGRVLDTDYLQYVSDIGADRWRQSYTASGVEEIRSALAVKNTIPNVSACVFRKDALAATLAAHSAEIERYRVAGDWMAYVRLLQHGKIAFDPRPLNQHRRHAASVTASALPGEELLREITEIQDIVASENELSPRIKAVAAAYREELRAQFGLNRPT